MQTLKKTRGKKKEQAGIGSRAMLSNRQEPLCLTFTAGLRFSPGLFLKCWTTLKTVIQIQNTLINICKAMQENSWTSGDTQHIL